MKILGLRFKNLNSLYGEWFIDFTDPEYLTNGIFALTGPTGAGKSTILDAICLALYGATPRLNKITKSGNEIMSRQTGECYAEVVFESQAGLFCCHWSQHRARKKPGGELQGPRHEISEGNEDGKVIENQVRRVSTVVEEKTGMDFDRFTRSILLAQGGFDTFLKANVEQKSKILEQITGTGIYTEISRRVHERQRDEREKLNLIQAEISGIAILEPEQEKEIQQELDNKQKQEPELTTEVTKTDKAITWLNLVDGLKKEISSLSEESEKLQTELETFKPKRKRLYQALKAAELEGEYAALNAVRKQQATDHKSLKPEEDKLPELEIFFNQQNKTLQIIKKQTNNIKDELKQIAPLLRKIRSLDQKLTEQKKTVSTLNTECEKERRKIEAKKKLRLKEEGKKDEIKKCFNLEEKYLQEHSPDEWLISGLAGIKEQIGSLLLKQKEIVQKVADEQRYQVDFKQSCQTLANCKDQDITRQLKLQKIVKDIEKEREKLKAILSDRLLREYRSEQETLFREMAFLARIAKLEEHRAKLEDGKPCPLCGSDKHPFAEGNVPAANKTEKKIDTISKLIRKAEAKEKIIENLETIEGKARQDLVESENLKITATNEKKTAEKNLSELTGNLEKMRTEFKNLNTSLYARLETLDIKEHDGDFSSLLELLQIRLKKWQVRVKEKAEFEKQISASETELKRLDAVIETLTSALSEKQKKLHSLKKEYADGVAQRQKIYGDKSPDTEENRLNLAITAAELSEKQTTIQHGAAQEKLNSTKTRVMALNEQIKHRIPELEKLESEFSGYLRTAGFNEEKLFMEARLISSEVNELNSKAKEMDERQISLKARKKDRKNRLIAEVDKKVTDKTITELEPELKEIDGDLKQLRNTIAGLKHKITENIAAKKQIRDKQIIIEAQKIEYRRFEKLHALIGSADGKKYRNFAQGLTFELMVSHANRQLAKMTDRYLLIRDDEQPLELNVIDNYQAGEIRSTRNLSGGESFIVSLTLALGLSKMASRKVRVDSLFLDEGFGTLDEDSLETALETLSNLHQNGKLIGIISHVSALKERISTQITITPESGGRSIVNGPGCRKIT